MPVSVAFAPPDTLLVHASGAITYAECRWSVDQMLTLPGAAAARALLVETHAVEAVPTVTELRAIARDMRPLVSRGMRHMAIVTNQPHVFGVARMFAVFAEIFDMHVGAFRSSAEAEAWLAAESAGTETRD